jgi:hypothetical protein
VQQELSKTAAVVAERDSKVGKAACGLKEICCRMIATAILDACSSLVVHHVFSVRLLAAECSVCNYGCALLQSSPQGGQHSQRRAIEDGWSCNSILLLLLMCAADC